VFAARAFRLSISIARRGRGVPSQGGAVCRRVRSLVAWSERHGTHLARRAVTRVRAAPSGLWLRARRGCARRAGPARTACTPRSQRATHQRSPNVGRCAAGREFPYTPGAAAARRSRAPTSASSLRARATRHAGCQLDNPTWRYLTSRLRFSCICRFPLGFQSHLKGRRTLRSRAQCEGFVLRMPPGACAPVRRAHAEALTEAHVSARSSIVDAALKQRGGRSVTSDARESAPTSGCRFLGISELDRWDCRQDSSGQR
jgi:hypothetical protein